MLDLSDLIRGSMHIFIDESEYNTTSFIYGAIAISDRNVNDYRFSIKTAREELQSDPYYFQFFNIRNLKKSFQPLLSNL